MLNIGLCLMAPKKVPGGRLLLCVTGAEEIGFPYTLRLFYIMENLLELEALARLPALRRARRESPQAQIQPVYMSSSRPTRATAWVVVEDRNQQIWEFQTAVVYIVSSRTVRVYHEPISRDGG